MKEVLDVLLSYPVIIPFIGFAICVCILFLSAITIGLDKDFEMPSDIFGIDNPLVTAGLSKVPLFLGLTMTFLPMTIMNIILNEFIYSFIKEIPLFGSIGYYVLSIVMILVTFIVSLYIAGYILNPLEKAIENSKLSVSYLFQEGMVNSNGISDEYGEVKVIINNSYHLLKAKLEADSESVSYGDKIIILRVDDVEEDKYIVKKI